MDAGQVYALFGSYGFAPVWLAIGVPSMDKPNRQLTCRRHGSSLPAGCAFALMMLAAAPTPCRRTGFHISSSSWWLAATAGAVEVAGVVGSTIIRSPGWAASMALWMLAVAATCVGALPPLVTGMPSVDCLPLLAVTTSSPHSALEPPYCTCCCTLHAATCGPVVGRGTTICVSD